MTTAKRKREPTIEITPDEWGLIRRQISMSRDIIERFARLAEEYESSHLANEEIRELLKELTEEMGHWADSLSQRMDRQERYVILKGMGGGRETIQIEQVVAHEHIDRALREELVNQQELILQYQRNADKVKLKIAKFGETVPLLNELDDYQKQVEKANEAIARIRENLD